MPFHTVIFAKGRLSRTSGGVLARERFAQKKKVEQGKESPAKSIARGSSKHK